MMSSLRYSQLALRIGLAAVFFWFGIDKFIHPHYWIDAWVPGGVISFFDRFGLSDVNLVYLVGIFELLVGTSLLSMLFIRFFSLAAVGFLAAITIVHGPNETLVRDIGLAGGLLALSFWPDRRYP